jgi:hypothetical protein
MFVTPFANKLLRFEIENLYYNPVKHFPVIEELPIFGVPFSIKYCPSLTDNHKSRLGGLNCKRHSSLVLQTVI